MLWLELFFRIINGIGEALLDELFWVVVILVAVQHWRIAKGRERFFGLRGGSVVMDTLHATFFGILGGILGSFLLVLTGVSLESIGIRYIWPLALFLMLISPRFLCFSYAGGIIALSSLVIGFPERISVPQLMALVAILHLVESFLIVASGHRGAVPIYTRSKATGQIVGGFTLQKFWPIPLIAMMLVSAESVDSSSALAMPDWWPVIKPYFSDTVDKIYTLIPVLAALGYGDLAMARTPLQKSKISARNLSLYGLILLVLAMLAPRYEIMKYLAALFAPLGHELVIYLGQKVEFREKPIFVPPAQGVMVLEAVPHTVAGDMGIRPGDVIRSVNDIEVNSHADINTILMTMPNYLQIEFIAVDSGNWLRKTCPFRGNKVFGVIPVPEGNESSYMELTTKGFIQMLWARFFHH